MNRLDTRPINRSNGFGTSALLSVLVGVVAAILVAMFAVFAIGNTQASAPAAPPTPIPNTPSLAGMSVNNQTETTPTAAPPAPPTPLPTAALPAPTPVPAQPQPNPNPLNAWYSEFFDNPDLEGAAVVLRNDNELGFNFRAGSADPRLPTDNFSARFTGRFNFDQTDNIQFSLVVDDAARVYFDERLIIDEWHMGGRRVAKVNVPVVKGEHHLRVEYAETTGLAQIALTWQVHYDAWQCRYYNTTDWTGPVLLRTNEGALNGALIQDWGEGGPGNGVGNDNFSADCRATISVGKTGEYNFKLLADDGMRVYIDGVKVYDNLSGPIQVEVPIRLRAGRHTIQTQYVERGGGAAQHIEWAYVPPPAATPVPTALAGS